ncbi:MAG: DMT family transporter [Pararhodobacter sp.]|nr:DMT family transporter [Pararhodobacter sp.]
MPENRTLAAAASVLGYATLIGLTDNYVRVVAADTGLWQFHFIRTLMALPLFLLAAALLGLKLRPVNLRAVVARSLVHGSALMVYFGCLAFLTVAQVAAGLFTAPIFVLLLSRYVYGHALGPVRIVAVALGFAGVIMLLTPGSDQPLGWASILPVAAGALYALGNLATREWCMGESAATLTLGFFLALGTFGLAGTLLFTLLPFAVPEGTAGFVLRGWVSPSADFLALTALHALGSVLGVGMVVRAYQLAEASRVSVFEYAVLPIAAGWGWLLWGESITWLGLSGMALIAGAGSMIALRGR